MRVNNVYPTLCLLSPYGSIATKARSRFGISSLAHCHEQIGQHIQPARRDFPGQQWGNLPRKSENVSIRRGERSINCFGWVKFTDSTYTWWYRAIKVDRIWCSSKTHPNCWTRRAVQGSNTNSRRDQSMIQGLERILPFRGLEHLLTEQRQLANIHKTLSSFTGRLRLPKDHSNRPHQSPEQDSWSNDCWSPVSEQGGIIPIAYKNHHDIWWCKQDGCI